MMVTEIEPLLLGLAGEGWEVAQVGACLVCPKIGVPWP